VVSVDRPSATSAVKEEADGGARLLLDSRAQDSGLRLLNSLVPIDGTKISLTLCVTKMGIFYY
jgi:hypothetical protein